MHRNILIDQYAIIRNLTNFLRNSSQIPLRAISVPQSCSKYCHLDFEKVCDGIINFQEFNHILKWKKNPHEYKILNYRRPVFYVYVKI